MSAFGTKLKDLRKKNKITQRSLADKVGVDFTYISKMENGQLQNFPSIEIIKKIAEALETDENELILLAKKVPEGFRETIIDDKLAIKFLRSMPTMPREKKEAIEKILDGE